MEIKLDLQGIEEFIDSEIKDEVQCAVRAALQDAVGKWAVEKANQLAAQTYRDLIDDAAWVKRVREGCEGRARDIIVSSATAAAIKRLIGLVDTGKVDAKEAIYQAVSLGNHLR